MGFTHFSGVDAEQLKIDGTLLTVTAAELNAMSGGGLSAAELGVLDGATAGTQVASKAVIADANVNTGISKVTELHIGASGSETQVTSTAAELNLLDGSTAGTQVASVAVIADANVNIGITKVTELHIGATGAETQVNATAAEINQAADVSARVQEITAAGAQAVTAGVQSVELNNNTTAIAATIANSVNHQGLFIVKATSEPAGGQDHTLTLTSGTWDGTNTIATLADINDALVVYFDSAGNGTIVENVGAVVLS
jgi:hypothetical protein